MSIFILEDDIMQGQYLKSQILNIVQKLNIPYDFIEVTSKPNEILEQIAQCTYIPIYFLDIEIKNELRKGLDVAQEIRNLDPHGIIVFITTHAELAPISYQYMVSALTFIDKNMPLIERQQLLKETLKHYQIRNNNIIAEDFLIIENRFSHVKVPFETVEYIMTDEPHRLSLITTTQIIQFYGTLKEIELIDERLIRCHKSFLVNCRQIERIEKTTQQLMLKTGKTVPVSRRMIHYFQKKLKEEEK
ncbi:LytR/AlgR family response regulator transcription factor [Kurthia huakuii]|uniref:LytR/AlgR family response regulator transcription factor n=1 Tax=Kurthia huakuii TaxID=1421019 RepID=UPI0004962A49|nr:response regulator transcription factor [Kurthia huakuii]MBM7698781.1 two-component system response regulator AgrA [Kurthia huakuii]